jgi:hypothetical protein
MEKEVIFNIFPICNKDIILSIGFRVHEFSGSDQEKIEYLLSKIETDIKEMAYIKVPDNFKLNLPTGEIINGITHERYNNLLYNGTEGILYESIFQMFNAPVTPLSVSTMYVDGEIKITEQRQFEAESKTKFTTKITENISEHYLKKYMTDKGFEFAELINVDFMEAIKLLLWNQKYTSTIKLLMAAIDTFAFLEYGDIKGSYKKWLEEFCEVSLLGVNEDELWEYRNSILHMTNANSRKVIQNHVQRLSFYISDKDIEFLTTNGDAKYFNLLSLIKVINFGILKWVDSFNTNREKFGTFCKRYDLIISDNRYNRIEQ